MDCSPLASSVHGMSSGKNSGVGCHFLLQGVFPIQGWNRHLPHGQADALLLSHLGSPLSGVGAPQSTQGTWGSREGDGQKKGEAQMIEISRNNSPTEGVGSLGGAPRREARGRTLGTHPLLHWPARLLPTVGHPGLQVARAAGPNISLASWSCFCCPIVSTKLRVVSSW